MRNYRQAARETTAWSGGKNRALALDEAISLFNQLADREDMGWGYIRTTCYPKAYMACEHALKHNIKPLKAWAFEDDRPLKGMHPSGGEFRWTFHVALALPVKLPDGRTENLVFDPALFSAPVSLNEWNSVIGAKPERLIVCGYNEAPPSKLAGPGAPSYLAHTPELTKQAQAKLTAWRRLAEPGPRLVYESQTVKPFVRTRLFKSRPGWKIIKDQTPTSPNRSRLRVSTASAKKELS